MGGAAEGGEEDERMAAIRQHYQADKDKLARIKALQVRRISQTVGKLYSIIGWEYVTEIKALFTFH